MSSRGEYHEEKEVEEKDVKELEAVFDAITKFIKDIQQPLRELFETLLSPIRGDIFGKELASFYNNLREGGVPEEMAQKMTMEYFEKRIRILDTLGSLGGLLSRLQGSQGLMKEYVKRMKGAVDEEEDEGGTGSEG